MSGPVVCECCERCRTTNPERLCNYCKTLPAPRAMKLWLVEGGGWGWSFTVVCAETAEDARRVAHEPDGEVTELTPGAGETILWAWEHSPDTPRE